MSFILASYALEKSIQDHLVSCNTLSGSLISGSNLAIYTGIGNVDKAEAPAVIIDAKDCNELYYGTRNYEFFTKIVVKEIAYDTDIDKLGVIAGSVFNEFADSSYASSFCSSNTYKINVWQVQLVGGLLPEIDGDALVTTGNYRIIGAQVP